MSPPAADAGARETEGVEQCPCFRCSPTHIAPANAGTLRRMRCLQLNWVHSPILLAEKPCPIHVSFFKGFPAERAKITGSADCRTMTMLGLHDNPYVIGVTMDIETIKFRDQDKTIQGGDDEYGIVTTIRCDDSTGLPYKYGEPGQLMLSFMVVFKIKEGGKTLDEMKNWDAIIGLLKEGTEMSFTKTGQVLQESVKARFLENYDAGVEILELLVF